MHEEFNTQENKPQEQIAMERKAEEAERKIVRFTNIDNESFTHSFRGISITVKAGISQIMRAPEGDHLALHLARKILSREKKKKLGLEKAGFLFPQNEIDELKSKILSYEAEEQLESYTPEEAHKRDLEQLAQKYDKTTEPTKKDVIKDLESRGIKVDVSKSKEDLLKDLIEAERRGK